MRLATLLKILIGLVVAAVIAIVVALLVIDPNEFKDDIVAAVKAETGRDFAIDSDISLSIGLTPSIAVQGVHLANAQWGSRPEMVTIGEFAAEVALIPLIFGTVQINRLVLRDADILIETDAQGHSNLAFGAKGEEQASGGGAAQLPQINDVRIENAVLTLIDGATGKTTKVDVKRLSAQADSLSAPLAVELDGSVALDGQVLDFGAAGELGAPSRLLAHGEPYPVALALTAFGLTANINGAVADPSAAKGLDIDLKLAGPNLAGLAPLAGDAVPSAGPIAVSAKLSGDADNALLENIKIAIGKTEASGRVALDARGARPRLTAAIDATQINLAELLPSGGPSADANAGAKPDKLFSADPLPLGALKALDANLEFAVAMLVLPNATLHGLTGALALDNGALAIKPLNIVIADSAVAGEIGVDTRSGPAVVAIELKSPTLDLGGVLREFAGLDKLRGSGALDVSLRGNGRSVAEIMGSLNGHSRLLMGRGEMKNEFLGAVSGLTQTVGEAFGKKEWIVVECIASDFDVASGVAKSRINAINTELLLVTVDGQIDLGREELHLKATPQSKGIDLSLAVPVNIGGTLANPSFAPDTLATAKKVGGILGAIAFPPAAVIGLGELGASDNPCLQTAAPDKPAQQQQSAPATPVESVTEGAKGALEGVGEGLKKLFGK